MKRFIACCIALFGLYVHATAGRGGGQDSPPRTYRINGNVRGVKSGTPIYLLHRPTKFRVDTLAIANVKRGDFQLQVLPTTVQRGSQQLTKVGTFEFLGDMELNGMLCYLAIDSGRQELPVFLDDRDITLHATGRSWPASKLSGSAINTDFAGFRTLLVERDHYFGTLLHPEPEQVYTQLIDSASSHYKSAGYSQRFQRWVDLYMAYTETLIQFVQRNPDAVLSAFLLNGTRFYQIQRVYAGDNFERLYQNLGLSAMESFYGKRLRLVKDLMEADRGHGFIGVGHTAPNIAQTDSDGRAFALDEKFSGGSKCVFVDFWAASCVACRKAMPFYKRLLEEFGNHGFSIVAYSHDTDEKTWRSAIAKDGTASFHHIGAVHDPEKSVFRDYRSPIPGSCWMKGGESSEEG